MNNVKVPSRFQNMFGKRISLLELVLALVFGIGMTTSLLVITNAEWKDFAIWQVLILTLITFDNTIGIVANLLFSANLHYKINPKSRISFILLHVHPIVLAGLLGSFYGISFTVWGYTVVAAFIVNALIDHPSQRIIGAILAVLGVSFFLLLAGPIPKILLAVLSLHMFKVIFCFAVDHDVKRVDQEG